MEISARFMHPCRCLTSLVSKDLQAWTMGATGHRLEWRSRKSREDGKKTGSTGQNIQDIMPRPTWEPYVDASFLENAWHLGTYC